MDCVKVPYSSWKITAVDTVTVNEHNDINILYTNWTYQLHLLHHSSFYRHGFHMDITKYQNTLKNIP